ncbi:ECF transporter S component [Bifidobacterium mongoliense]|uniref:ECF transporter S component n=1 Tax=Bifidobacterium mongoliense TaxID=518643 RepID=UPI0026478EB5|nr:ECF transporter S component [Bifidobacterium mongoliense]MDN5979013.1 ECF transporter S component [Bifidobacterium mongoliense]
MNTTPTSDMHHTGTTGESAGAPTPDATPEVAARSAAEASPASVVSASSAKPAGRLTAWMGGVIGLCLLLLMIQSGLGANNLFAFATAVAPMIVAAAFWVIERGLPRVGSLGEITASAAFAALAVVSRIVKLPIPDVELTSFIVILAGLSLGAESGFLIGSLTALISNIWLGQGAWTPWQMLAWGLMGAAAGWIRHTSWSRNRIVMALWGIASAFVYGWILDIWTWLAYTRIYTVPAFFGTLGASAPFDAINAASTAVLLLIATPWAVDLIQRTLHRGALNTATSTASSTSSNAGTHGVATH